MVGSKSELAVLAALAVLAVVGAPPRAASAASASAASAASAGALAAPGPPQPIVVVSTWGHQMGGAAAAAAAALARGAAPLDAVVAGASWCEAERCDGTVGYGGSPDEAGATTLDALVMDGATLGAGAVAAMPRVRAAAAAAAAVLRHTTHTLLAGPAAAAFAEAMGLPAEGTETPESAAAARAWREERACQPNFWRAGTVLPDPRAACGPYAPAVAGAGAGAGAAAGGPHLRRRPEDFPSEAAHDTIALAALDGGGRLAAGCSTNGAAHKVPGRVGDCPVPGAGAYADGGAGACGATGDGDAHLRVLPCFVAVEAMRRGAPPAAAAAEAVARAAARLGGGYVGAVVVLAPDGRHAAACHGFASFSYAVARGDEPVRVIDVACAAPPPAALDEAARGGLFTQ